MKANELMIGDLLRVNRDGLCIKKDTIVQIRGIDGDNKFEERKLVGCAGCQPLDKTQFAGGIWLDYLSPIPITPEILEKNFGPEINGMYFDGNEFQELMIQEVNDGTWIIKHDCVEFSGIPRQQVMVCYVHELQHALRLCGIYKEIEL